MAAQEEDVYDGSYAWRKMTPRLRGQRDRDVAEHLRRLARRARRTRGRDAGELPMLPAPDCVLYSKEGKEFPVHKVASHRMAKCSG